MGESKINAMLDITPDICPVTFVKTKLKLEQLHKGDILEVILNGGEAIKNVPRSVKGEGHKIVMMEKIGEKYRLLIEKGGYAVNIKLNGEKELLDKEYTVNELIREYELSPDMVTINLNGTVLLRETFDNIIIKSGDSVDLLFSGKDK
ncbi:MAG: hypothetical protein A4E55_00995 [Pelotomaculum sp. PtaU1.Bin035]|nr:MAG: hypothetical protein A4E55_00995 [Pelotomaculum sp. PtaU1.Bin035]